MDLGLKGRVAVVAASSKGLGRAVAEALADEGVRLVISARGAEALAHAEGALKSWGAEVVAVRADVTDPGTPEHLVSVGDRAVSAVSTSSCRTPAAHRQRARSTAMTRPS